MGSSGQDTFLTSPTPAIPWPGTFGKLLGGSDKGNLSRSPVPNNSLDCWEKSVGVLSDGSPSHLKNPMRGFFKLFLRFFCIGEFRPLRWAMGALPLNPAIFREKSSKAFDLRDVIPRNQARFDKALRPRRAGCEGAEIE